MQFYSWQLCNSTAGRNICVTRSVETYMCLVEHGSLLDNKSISIPRFDDKPCIVGKDINDGCFIGSPGHPLNRRLAQSPAPRRGGRCYHILDHFDGILNSLLRCTITVRGAYFGSNITVKANYARQRPEVQPAQCLPLITEMSPGLNPEIQNPNPTPKIVTPNCSQTDYLR